MYFTVPSKDLLIEEFKYNLAKHILMNRFSLANHIKFIRMVGEHSGVNLVKPI